MSLYILLVPQKTSVYTNKAGWAQGETSSAHRGAGKCLQWGNGQLQK